MTALLQIMFLLHSKYFRLSVLTLAAAWLMTGIREDDEFSEIDLFLKYRPTWQVWFHSPLGMQDMPAGYPSHLIAAERVYDDFVHGHHWSAHLGSISLLLIQLFLSCAAACMAERTRKHPLPYWKAGAHLLINIVPSSLLLTLMLFENQWFSYLLYGSGIVAVNTISIFILHRKNQRRNDPVYERM